MPGPPPKFTPEQRAKQRNPGRRPSDVVAPGERADFFPPAPTVYPSAPPELLAGESSIAERARLIWDSLIGQVVDARVYRDTDAVAFARYCRYLSEWIAYNEELDAGALFSTDQNGQLRRHPAIIARKTVEDAMDRIEQQFGLQPAHRIKLTKQLAASLKDLPLAGRSADGTDKRGGPVGFLKRDKTESDE